MGLGGLGLLLAKEFFMNSQTSFLSGQKMPVVFIGHGSPMNALAENAFSRSLAQLGRELPRPKAILVISAHWLTAGSFITHMDRPRTIHDFYGFPQALFDVQYPAPGSAEAAERIKEQVQRPPLHLDESWGLDHGTWSVLKHMYPLADIPVLQLSIDMSEPPAFHLALGEQLAKLREQGILILGSGNIVHNLRELRWGENSKPHDWALEFDAEMKKALLSGDTKGLTSDLLSSPQARLSVPTPDHYYPLLYAVGAAQGDKNGPRFIYEGVEVGSISMRSLVYG